MDFNSLCKKRGYSYTAPTIKVPMPTLMEMKREVADDIFRKRTLKSHDCRDQRLVDARDKNMWEAWLLSHGVRQSAKDVTALFAAVNEEDAKDQADRLMCTIGSRGKHDGQFQFPRGVAVDDEGNIFVADSKNHRIQVFNSCGIFKKKFGTKGTKEGHLDTPTGVTMLPNDDVAVCEQKNKRIQIFSPKYKYKSHFATEGEPIAITCDNEFHIIIATTDYTVEVYSGRQATLLHKFNLPKHEAPATAVKAPKGALFLAVNDKSELIVSDPVSCTVASYKYDGVPVHQFSPTAHQPGLGFIPAGVECDGAGQFLVADQLNHLVNFYSDRGEFKRHVAGPRDCMGAVQALTLGSEGHLVVVECTNNGPHCVKIFRTGHRDRPGSSIHRTPIPSDDEWDLDF